MILSISFIFLFCSPPSSSIYGSFHTCMHLNGVNPVLVQILLSSFSYQLFWPSFIFLFMSCFNSYVSEKERRHDLPSQAQRHILAGLASAVGGLSAPYERASHIHERPVLNWLWAVGCHPFGPFSNTSRISQMLHDVARVMPKFILSFFSI